MKPLFADRMLGKLARLLRMVGQDVEYQREGDAGAIIERAASEGRILLTRDRKLLAKAPQSLYVASNYPFHQTRQVIGELGLTIDRRFTRCIEDNGVLEPAPHDEAIAAAPPAVADSLRAGSLREVFRCGRCKRLYWEGTHVEAMRSLIASLEGAPLVLDPDAEDPNDGVSRLEPLLDLHQALDVILLRHRLALMSGDVIAALPLFRRFAVLLQRHIADEDELVLPIYAANVPTEGFERGASPTVMSADHENIKGHLDRLRIGLEALAKLEPGEQQRVACLRLLDREKVFADLLEHHDLRERRYLYPALERLLSDEEKTELLERMVGSSFKEPS